MKNKSQQQIIESCIKAFKTGQRPASVPFEFLGAFKIGHRKHLQNHIDDEYAYSLLSDWLLNQNQQAKEALLFLAKYNDETYRGNTVKGNPDHFFGEPIKYKEITDEQYARRNDVMNRPTVSCEDLSGNDLCANPEDALIEWIDFQSSLAKKK